MRLCEGMKRAVWRHASMRHSRLAGRLGNNMMVVSTGGYAQLAVKLDLELAGEVEAAQVRAFRGRCAMAERDAAHALFMPRSRFGDGYKSAVVEQLKGLAREAEVALNDRLQYGVCTRARLQAARASGGEWSENVAVHAARELARHRIFLRDGGHAFASRIIDNLAGRAADRHRGLPHRSLYARYGAPSCLGPWEPRQQIIITAK